MRFSRSNYTRKLKLGFCYHTFPSITITYLLAYLNVNDFVDLPDFNDETNKDADFDDEVRLVVQNVEENDERLKHAEEDGTH